MDKPNVIERIIANVSPQWAYQRSRARINLELSYKMRKYAAASRGPLTEDWRGYPTSAWTEVRGDRARLANLMRELVRNDGWAYAALNTLTNNVVGKGIVPSIMNKDGSEGLKALEKEFLNWCRSVTPDFCGKLTFFGIQGSVFQSAVESGDVLIIKRYVGRGRKMQLSLQVLESDYLATSYSNYDTGINGVEVIDGIYKEISTGKVVGYEIYNDHPGSNFHRNGLEHKFVSADDCILFFRPERPGQDRGVVVAHSVMLDHKLLSDYELAQAHRQRIAASFAAFITTTNAAEFGSPGVSSTGTHDIDYPDMSGERIRPGTIQYLFPGENLELATPPLVDGYDEYTKARLKKMAKGWGLSYESLSGDLSETTYSSFRGGWIEQQRNIERWQFLTMIPQFCNVVFRWWIELEMLKRDIQNISDVEVVWTPPRREMIDPGKETKAIIEQIAAGIKSFPDAIRETGRDPREVLEEIHEWYGVVDKLGLKLSTDYRNDIKNKAVEPDDEEEEEKPRKKK